MFRSWWWLVPALVLAFGMEAPAQVKDQPLGVHAVRAFPNLRIRRPVVLTNANDGSDRIFICTQQGVIHVMPNDENVKEPTTFLDIEKQVVYKDTENEEGLLGLAFHPKYKENGQFFVYYNTKDAAHTTVVSRFRVSKDNPDKADPASEEELLRIPQPFWNHNGGSIEFGPDGMLYIGLGDGGAGNDPHGNGQNLKTLLGSILRIDVDHKDEGKQYAVPKDNPFVDKKDAAPEIWSYGWRNVWRLTFDRKTGHLWAADVGQNVWEEINIVQKGGNYGWNKRESMHPFDPKNANAGKIEQSNKPDPKRPGEEEMIDPIFEYHHDIGKSITGGYVYRGKKVPKLEGCYLYADYVTNKVWALKYDEKEKKVVANYTISTDKLETKPPVITFGEDEAGEVYFTDAFGFIYKFAETK